MKNRISLALLFSISLCITGCSCLDLIEGIIGRNEGLTLNASNVTLQTGEKYQLEVSKPGLFDLSSYIWYSSNESVVVVNSNGLVTALKGGVATVTVEDAYDSSLTAACQFTVQAGITNLTLSNVKKNYRIDESFVKPTVTANYDDGTTKEIQNSCSFQGYDMKNEGIYKVNVNYSEGKVTAKTNYNIRVTNGTIPTLVDIELSGQKSSFIQGDRFEFGGTVTAKYSDGTTDDVTNLCTFSNYDMSTPGKQYPMVTYTENGNGTKSKAYEIEVSEVTTDLTPTKMKSTYVDVTTNSMYSNFDSAPSVGSPKFLIVPVWFSDSSNYINASKKESVRQDIQKAYLGTTEDTGWNSVKSFYAQESRNKLNINGVVTDWYETGESISKYDTDSATGQTLTSSLAKKVSNQYFTDNPSVKTSFDSDHDGYLDGIILIYAGPNYSIKHPSDETKDNLWAYCFWATSTPSVSSPTVCSYFWASFDFMYGNSEIYSKTGKTSTGAGDTTYCNIDAHTYIHEMGHILGLDDYYDYSNDRYMPAGGYSMQDLNMGGHDPFSCMALGWADPFIPRTTSNIELRPFQSSGDLIVLTPNWNTYDSPFDEYLILEYYTPTGLNAFDAEHPYAKRSGQMPAASGIRVWHVDARLAYIATGKTDLTPTQMTTNPKDSNKLCVVACKNTYSGPHSSVLALEGYSQFYTFNLLQLIRKNATADCYPEEVFSSTDLFNAGSTFSMNTYRDQFYFPGRLNTNTDLGWTFRVNSLDPTKASITLIKE